MLIYTTWAHDGKAARLVAACDEYTRIESNGIPEFYTDAVKRATAPGLTLREIILENIDYRDIEAAFNVPAVSAQVAQ